MLTVVSNIKFRQLAFKHIAPYPILFQNSSTFCLNIDTVDAKGYCFWQGVLHVDNFV